jgi:hypothetical protein
VLVVSVSVVKSVEINDPVAVAVHVSGAGVRASAAAPPSSTSSFSS